MNMPIRLESRLSKPLTYRQLFDYWMGHLKVTIHMYDKSGHHAAFAITAPHSSEYIEEVQSFIDRAEIFQIGCGEPMAREAFFNFLAKGQRSPGLSVVQ